MTIKELIELKDILSSDSISTTRLTTNDNFHKLRRGLIEVIDTLSINSGPNVVVSTVQADDIVANSFSTPLPMDGVYNFRVNSNGEIRSKSIFTDVWVETPRLRLDPDPTIIAFQAGEIRWSGSDFLGFDGTNWISLTAGAAGGEANTASNIGTGTGIFSAKVGLDLRFKSLVPGTGVTFDVTNPDEIKINSLASSGYSGYSGISGTNGTSGYSGVSGFSGSGVSGFSGASGVSGRGVSGYSGSAGASGTSGFSGASTSGYSGMSGYSGTAGLSGYSGQSGTSGYSGDPGPEGTSGVSGFSGLGISGFSGISGASGTSSSVLGPPEDGSYLDGLWIDLTPSTPIGTFADRVNEILLALVPPPAPSLSSWSQTTMSPLVAGKLSFDSSNPILGYIGADTALVAPVFVDGLFNSTGSRLGITDNIGAGASGVLNYLVPTGPGTPSAAYVAQSFGEADKGYLKMYINGVEYLPARINLTSTSSSIDTSAGGSVTGISVSASLPSLFPSGTPMPSFQNRTGTWTCKKAQLSLGYNSIQIVHEVTPLIIHTLTAYDVVIDGNTTATSYVGETLYNHAMTGSKKLSGIDYHTGGTLAYDITINNAYRNTYSSSSSAISHTGNSNSYGVLLTAASQALGNNAGNEALSVVVSGKTVTFVSPARRIINENVSMTTTTLRTVQGTTISPGGSIGTFLLDNVASSSTLATLEAFDDEVYRLNSNSSFDLITDVSANPWDGTQSLDDGSAGHTTGLQIIDGKLIYPGANVSYPSDFTTANITKGSTFNNGGTGGSARDYTGLTGDRTYTRYFQKVSPTTANFTMTINGSGGTFVPLTTALTGNNIHVEIKGPTETGWMDAYADFATGQFADGDGARNASAGAGRAFGTLWGLTIGTKNTANTGGYMLVRITTGAGFTGSFTSINWNFV